MDVREDICETLRQRMSSDQRNGLALEGIGRLATDGQQALTWGLGGLESRGSGGDGLGREN